MRTGVMLGIRLLLSLTILMVICPINTLGDTTIEYMGRDLSELRTSVDTKHTAIMAEFKEIRNGLRELTSNMRDRTEQNSLNIGRLQAKSGMWGALGGSLATGVLGLTVGGIYIKRNGKRNGKKKKVVDGGGA